MKRIAIFSILSLAVGLSLGAQVKISNHADFKLEEPDSVLFEKVKYQGKEAFHLKKLRQYKKDEGPDAAILKDFEFTNGTIECDISASIFTGIAFRAKDGATFECIYFRPFNSGTEKHENTVQYVAKGSKYTWRYLRENHPGKYEAGADIAKEQWFHVRLDIREKSVKVYVDDSEEPVLVVDEMKYGLSSGSVGFWSWDGHFANLKISPD